MRRLTIGIGVVVVISLVAGVFLQQRRVERATVQIAELEERIEQEIPALKKENQSLRDQLESTTARMESNLAELMRSRGQGVKMRQLEEENARLRGELSRLTEQHSQLLSARYEATNATNHPPAIEEAAVELKASALASIAARYPSVDSSELVFSSMNRNVMPDGKEAIFVMYELPTSSETTYYDSPEGDKVKITTKAFSVKMSSSGEVESVDESITEVTGNVSQ